MLVREDLSLRHAPLGVLRQDAAAASFRLDETQLKHFEMNGFVAGIKVLDEDQVGAIACSDYSLTACLYVNCHELTLL
jgi:hypothetical protein